MKALLDTHTFLWWITDQEQLSQSVREIIGDGSNELWVSAVCGWEIAIKAKLGKLTLPHDPVKYVTEQLDINNFIELQVRMSHALHTYTLPPLHRDPFDRLLVAQSQIEQLPIITVDPEISRYAVSIIW